MRLPVVGGGLVGWLVMWFVRERVQWRIATECRSGRSGFLRGRARASMRDISTEQRHVAGVAQVGVVACLVVQMGSVVGRRVCRRDP